MPPSSEAMAWATTAWRHHLGDEHVLLDRSLLRPAQRATYPTKGKIVVVLRPGSQPADRPALAEIVFSTARWREEFGILKALDLESLLRRPDATAAAYVLKLNILNRTGPKPVPEPRLVPVAR